MIKKIENINNYLAYKPPFDRLKRKNARTLPSIRQFAGFDI